MLDLILALAAALGNQFVKEEDAREWLGLFLDGIHEYGDLKAAYAAGVATVWTWVAEKRGPTVEEVEALRARRKAAHDRIQGGGE